MTFKELFKKIIVWRLLILAVAIPALLLVAPRTRFTNLSPVSSPGDLATMWSNFDGLHYLDLAQYGYGYQHKTDLDYAFFPVYPWVISKLNIFGSYLASGLFVSHLSLLLALYFLYKLIVLDEKSGTARSVIILLLIFPTAFFFGSVYNESLFLLLTVLSFYFVRKQNYFLACVFAGIASATRVTGILLWPSIIYEFWLFHGKDIRKSFNTETVWLVLPPIGLLAYMKFQLIRVGDPLFFVHIQDQFAQRTTDKVILIYQVFFRYLKMLVFVNHGDPLFFTVLLEFLSACLIVYFLIWGFKKVRFSYWLYVLSSFLIPSLTGTFMSLPRFTIVLFPVFIFLAKIFEKLPKYYRIAYYTLCVIFSILSIVFFTRGYFVS